jgi:hypothetical protein
MARVDDSALLLQRIAPWSLSTASIEHDTTAEGVSSDPRYIMYPVCSIPTTEVGLLLRNHGISTNDCQDKRPSVVAILTIKNQGIK